MNKYVKRISYSVLLLSILFHLSYSLLSLGVVCKIMGIDFNYTENYTNCRNILDQHTNQKLYKIAPITEPVIKSHGLFSADSDVSERNNFVLRVNYIYIIILLLVPIIFYKSIDLLLKFVFAMSVILYGVTVAIIYSEFEVLIFSMKYFPLIVLLPPIYIYIMTILHKKHQHG